MRLALYVVAATVLSACAAPGPDRRTTDESVAAAALAWQSAYNSRDPLRITAMYDSEAVLWGTTSKTIAPTPAAIAEYFKDAGSRPTARVAIGEQHIRSYGNIAVDSGYYTFSEVRDGQTVGRPARFTFVFRNLDGQWRLIAHHSSQIP